MNDPPGALEHCRVILGNSNPRFSGVTSTMLQTLQYQQKQMPICVLGKHHLPPSLALCAVSLPRLASHLRKPAAEAATHIFHARRNNEMIQALLLKHLCRAKIKILFTSAAQRHHSAFTRFLMARMDRIISPCEAAAAYLDPRPRDIVPHGVCTDRFHPDSSRDPAAPLRLGIFGRVRPQKGTHLFVRAAIAVLPHYPGVTAHIVGEITKAFRGYADQLQAEIDSAGLTDRIRFHGEQPFDELPALFRSMDLVAALSDREGFGLTVLEAMSSGAAVIATETGAWPSIIENGRQGWLIPVSDLDALIARLHGMLADPRALRAMGVAGRQRVLQQYRIEEEARRLCEIYRELLQDSPYPCPAAATASPPSLASTGCTKGGHHPPEL